MSEKLFVLLVEDNALVRKMSIIMLEEQLNCRVDVATTGAEAFEFANKNAYDMILMDIGLPDRDGLSVIQDIRRYSKLNQNAPIIALTAHSDKGYIKESFEMGATDFYTKPLDHAIGSNFFEKYIERA